ncbi:MAG: glycoside hydrolase family 38 C-terminal domain-containing protein [FCB group bacterium]|jgi:alpha-mannosidase|nr:glycoside hydrolase family 38 C-terminal domain-containing protein [FCB group bacterium]
MAGDRKTVHVICNTHWDREWGYPFEETRLLLLDFMDELLRILDTNPDFGSFVFDSQTVGLEDYLELRPEMRPTIEKHVSDGRLIVGPWYSLPEEYIVNGESLLRNLVVGHKDAAALGKVSKVGYTPFSYGQTSQMPQIYNGFDIDTIIFYRGINTPNSEFRMESPDGSSVLGMRFGALSRFSYYFYVYRMLVYGMSRDEWWYDWNRGALPFRMATTRNPRGHYYILDPSKKQWHTEHIPEMLQKLVRDESEHFTTEHIACMQGFDTSSPDPREPEIIRMCQEMMPEHTIKQSSIAEYMDALKEALGDRELFTIRGESRDPGATGKWTHLFGDVISARTRIKRANARNEVNLQRLAEPWSALGSMVGGEYMRTSIDRAWKLLLKNHPHDTICGAGVDQMEKDVLNRAEQIDLVSEGVARRGMAAIQRNIDNSDLTENDVVFTVFNSCPFPRNEVVSAFIDLPDRTGYESFSVQTPEGEKLRVQQAERFEWGTLVRNLQDISLELRSERIRCQVEVKDIPAFGYKTLHLIRQDRDDYLPGSLATEKNVLENEHLRAVFNADGTIDLTQKATGNTFQGLHYLEDTGETGHSWTHMEPDYNQTITSHGFPVSIALEEAGPLMARMRVDYFMRIPVGLDNEMQENYRMAIDNHTSRSKETREVVVTSRFTLKAGQERLDVVTSFDNTCKNHRLRVLFPTRLDTDKTDSEAGFDVISRDIHIKETSAYFGKPNPQYPMHRFVDMSDGKQGFAILNTGIREYEAMDTAERPLAITLLRAFTFRQSPIIDRWDVYPDMELSQCPGRHEWTYAIYPHKGDWTSGVFDQAEALNLPLELAQAGAHEGTLPKSLSLVEVSGGSLQLTALKKAEDGDSYIVRLFNPTEKGAIGTLKVFKDIKHAWLTNLNEERQRELQPSGNTLSLKVGKKKIVTVEFEI